MTKSLTLVDNKHKEMFKLKMKVQLMKSREEI